MIQSNRNFTSDTKFEFDIKRERIHLRENNHDTGFDILYRDDTGTPLSIVSSQYKIITHKEANNLTEKHLTHLGYNYEIGATSVFAKGSRFFREFRFPELKFSPGKGQGYQTALDGGRRDEYLPSIIIYNSCDRSSFFHILLGTFRLVCSNGMIIGKLIKEMMKVRHMNHSNSETLTFNMALTKSLQALNLERIIEDMGKIYSQLNSLPAHDYLQPVMMEVMSKKMAETIAKESKGLIVIKYDNERKIKEVTASDNLSAYALLQLCTNVATHGVHKFHRSLFLQKQIAKVFKL